MPDAAMPLRALNLLLVEPQSMVRSTVVAVARELRLPRIDDTSSVETARLRLATTRYDGLLLSLDEQEPAIALLERLRAGETVSPADAPVVVMAARCDTGLALTLKQLEVSRLLIKPFKVKTLLETIEALAEQVVQRETA